MTPDSSMRNEVFGSDADAHLAAIERAWVSSKKLRGARPWNSAVLLVSYGDNVSSMAGYVFDGTLAVPCSPDSKSPLTSWDAFHHLRALTPGPDGALWTTLVLTYDEPTDAFTHTYVYGDDHPEWNVCDFTFDDDVVNTLQPRRDAYLNAPLSARAAQIHASRYRRRNELTTKLLMAKFRADELDGGWRLYTPTDPSQPTPLTDIHHATDHLAYLVTHTGRVTHTTEPVDHHQALLDGLGTRTT